MLSLARSRYTLFVQFGFLAMNAGGVLLGVIYNASTPDLYPNNAHHKLGWIVTVVVCAQVVVGLLARVAGALKREKTGSAEERQGFIPVSTEAMAEHESRFDLGPYARFSNDSGQGTELGTESLRSHSLSSGAESPRKEYHHHQDDDADGDLEAHVPMLTKSSKAHSMVAKVAGKISGRFWKVLLFAYNFVDRTILILGFIALCTGIIAYGRFFVSTCKLSKNAGALTQRRRATASSPAWLTGSRAAYSSGSASSRSAAGLVVLAILVGSVTPEYP
jgi:hypothetical protein